MRVGKIKLHAGGSSGGGNLAGSSSGADRRPAAPPTPGDADAAGEQGAVGRLQYPRSEWLRAEMQPADYLHLVRLSDCNVPEVGAPRVPGAADGEQAEHAGTPEGSGARVALSGAGVGAPRPASTRAVCHSSSPVLVCMENHYIEYTHGSDECTCALVYT